MSELDFRKQLLLNEFKSLSKGKKNDEMLPLIFAISSKAKQAGITFGPEDFEIILEQLKKDMSPEEQLLIPQLLQLLQAQHTKKQ
ncbi:MAG: hypothetical protein Q4F11_03015 [Eubacteriales bacterium]|nr:hypothetical protein [Eubacteriales bacterium]